MNVGVSTCIHVQHIANQGTRIMSVLWNDTSQQGACTARYNVMSMYEGRGYVSYLLISARFNI